MPQQQPVEDIDRGWLRIKRDMKAAARSPLVVDVGIVGSDAEEPHADSKLNNATVGTYHEHGAEGIPERSFLRATVDEKHNDIARLFDRVAKGVLGGKTTQKRGFGLVGEKVVSWVKARIRKGIPPPLSSSTIAQKGSSKPLIDTGQLIGSITHVVRGAGEGNK